jgi:hypothetical protein
MSPVDRHAMGMLSSVMRALKYSEAHALRGQRPSWRPSATTPMATPRRLSALSQSARPLVTGLAALGITLAPVAIAPPVASAAPTSQTWTVPPLPAPACTTTGVTTTCTFSFTGAAETLPLPAGINSVIVSLNGASGGKGGTVGGPGGSGGLGAAVTGKVAVASGQLLTVYVGGHGGDGSTSTITSIAPAGTGGFGYGSGGTGGARDDPFTIWSSGGGGGDASAVVAGTTPLAVAAGGGGGGGGAGRGSLSVGYGGRGGNSAASGGAGYSWDYRAYGGDGGIAGYQTVPDGGGGQRPGISNGGNGGGGGGGGGGLRGGTGGGSRPGGDSQFPWPGPGGGGGGGTNLVPAGGSVINGDHSGDGQVVISYQLDTTAPTTKISQGPSSPNGQNGWYTSAVSLNVSATDPESASGIQTRCALDPSPVPTSFAALPSGACAYLSPGASVASDGTHTLYAASIDPAGNAEAQVQSATFKIDAARPTIIPSATKADGTAYTLGTWTNQTVTVHFSCQDQDTLSGVASCPADQVFSTSGEPAYVFGAVTDKAGNSAGIRFGTLQVDKTPPTVSSGAGSYTVDQQVEITCTASDALSGVKVGSSTCQNISGPAYSFGLGSHSYSATATDNAGNVGHGSTSFTVTVTPSSLVALVNRFCTDPSVAASLAQDVVNIANAPNADAKAKALQPFTKKVQAQTGKSLTSDQAKVLITLANAL